jgi:tryptophan-rich sensory protein
LKKPTWNPPGWIFGPVWTALYLSMAVAAWLVWRRRPGVNITPAMLLFALQLILNLFWSVLFFGMRNPMLAFFEIILLWVAILLTTIACWRIRPKAGMLLLPYLAWVGFAALLNFSIWRMNA